MYASPRVSAGWFQRPYPYHLDFYRMRYGGSYAPYFGNLYGPSQVNYYPPYYGPYYGGNSAPYPMDYGQGYGMPADCPEEPAVLMPGAPTGEANATEKPAGEANTKSKGTTLPAPARQ
jgi:hypothetical protein